MKNNAKRPPQGVGRPRRREGRPEPEEEKSREPEIKVNWPSYVKEEVGIVEEAGILPEENALMGEDFGWVRKGLAHRGAGKTRTRRAPSWRPWSIR